MLIIGASGGIDTFVVQIARLYRAKVTGVCESTSLEMVRKSRADHVIDYIRKEYAQNDQKYDIIFDASGANTLFTYENILMDEGIYVINNPLKNFKPFFTY